MIAPTASTPMAQVSPVDRARADAGPLQAGDQHWFACGQARQCRRVERNKGWAAILLALVIIGTACGAPSATPRRRPAQGSFPVTGQSTFSPNFYGVNFDYADSSHSPESTQVLSSRHWSPPPYGGQAAPKPTSTTGAPARTRRSLATCRSP